MPDPYARLAGVYDELVVDPCFASWADYVTSVWGDDPHGVRSVLDVCCGTGLMTAELAARGLHVTGLDASAAMLARARERLGPDVTLVEATLPDLPDAAELTGPFDAIVSTFDGLNYLDLTSMRVAVGRLAGRLRPGGWLVFDAHAEAALDLVRDTPVVVGAFGADRFGVTYVVDEDARTCRSIMSLDGPRGFVEEHRQYLHTDAQWRAAIGAAGLDVVSVTDEYSGSPVGPTTLRATWTARRRPEGDKPDDTPPIPPVPHGFSL